jgi:hypothetical protein
MLQRGDLVPHFTVRTIEGRLIHYATIWQQRNLVLITLTADTVIPSDYAARLASASKDDSDTTWVVTRDIVHDMPCPGALVADRWGEIVHVCPTTAHAGLPDVDDLVEWLHFTQARCPECEGEAK